MEHEQQAHIEQDLLAAVDLGSNSFHMIIARLRDGQFQILDRLREMVQLRAGLDKENRLSVEAQDRAIACLERFGQRVRELPNGTVRVVGTNTLRVAENSRDFLRRARLALGHPIEIVTGEEEARLIYLGVAKSLAFDTSRRLVMDIGGGSTEFIIGEGLKGLRRESLEMGCVSFSQKFFPDDLLTDDACQKALLSAAVLLRSIQRPYLQLGWQEAIGASGTIRCVANIAKANGWCDDGVITMHALDMILVAMKNAGHTDKLKLDGLTDERAKILAGGVCVLKAAFERLRIDRMIVSDGALREGLLYDLLGRIQHDDERERTVSALAKRYGVDELHAERVSVMADQLYQQVAIDWQIVGEEFKQRLQWAARLHEIGLAISHDQFHKHAGYLVAHSDMPGFSREEQQSLAAIVRAQRRKFPINDFDALPDELQTTSMRLAVILRLAMVFNRGRSEQADTFVGLEVTIKGLRLSLPEGWLANHRLTEADLRQERSYLKAIGIKLKITDH